MAGGSNDLLLPGAALPLPAPLPVRQVSRWRQDFAISDPVPAPCPLGCPGCPYASEDNSRFLRKTEGAPGAIPSNPRGLGRLGQSHLLSGLCLPTGTMGEGNQRSPRVPWVEEEGWGSRHPPTAAQSTRPRAAQPSSAGRGPGPATSTHGFQDGEGRGGGQAEGGPFAPLWKGSLASSGDGPGGVGVGREPGGPGRLRLEKWRPQPRPFFPVSPPGTGRAQEGMWRGGTWPGQARGQSWC